MDEPIALGATYLGGGRTQFLVWAPEHPRVELKLVGPRQAVLPMTPAAEGYHKLLVENSPPGTEYLYRLGGAERPDPVSHLQSASVHGPSVVVDPTFQWTDAAWRGLPLHDYVIYELHIGTFTPEGTFDSAIAQLESLAALGITAVQIMPVAQFPGSRNWGYDGVFPHAVQNTYGGSAGLKRLVDACHGLQLAAVLDVVYNHLGPEGNYLAEFGHYFTAKHHTPWGPALNFDGPHSEHVRRYFIENAVRWIDEFHIDALRLDAIHAIVDHSDSPFLLELAAAVHERGEKLGRPALVIAESNRNDPRVVSSPVEGGLGHDAQYLDDFERALHVQLTGERGGYYADYADLEHLGKAISQGFVLTGQFSFYRGRPHGASSAGISPERFAVFAENHDSVGNRPDGRRLGSLIDLARTKLAAAATLLSPYVPALFMGQEYGETAPFHYFVSHSDPHLIEGVRKGRKRDFVLRFKGVEPADPQDERTMAASRLNRQLLEEPRHQMLWLLHRELLALRRELPSIGPHSRAGSETIVDQEQRVLMLHRQHAGHESWLVMAFGEGPCEVPIAWPGSWQKRLDTADARWLGPVDEDGLPPVKLNAPGPLVIHAPVCQLWERTDRT